MPHVTGHATSAVTITPPTVPVVLLHSFLGTLLQSVSWPPLLVNFQSRLSTHSLFAYILSSYSCCSARARLAWVGAGVRLRVGPEGGTGEDSDVALGVGSGVSSGVGDHVGSKVIGEGAGVGLRVGPGVGRGVGLSVGHGVG